MTYCTDTDAKVFGEVLARDPESRRCFECGYDNAPWCVLGHGIFTCLDCSGIFRSLGTHICFVRCSTMDGWSNWKPEKLELIKHGGNAKCRKFFDSHGVPPSVLAGKDKPGAVPLQEKFMHRAAMMYVDKLQAEASGQPFNEAAWQPPQWWESEMENIKRRKEELANPELARARQQERMQQQRFQGYGSGSSSSQSQQQHRNGEQHGGTDEFLNFLGSAASKLTETTSYYAKEASTKTKQWYEEVEKNANSEEITQTAKKSADAVSEVATNAWGTLSSWTTTGFAAVSALASQAGDVIKKELDGDEEKEKSSRKNRSSVDNDNQNDEDGLRGLTRNVRPSQQDYGHSEHSKAEATFTPQASPQQKQQNSSQQQQQQQQQSQNQFATSSPPTSPPNQSSSNATTSRVTSGPKAVVAAVPAKRTFKGLGSKKTNPADVDDIFASPSSATSTNTQQKASAEGVTENSTTKNNDTTKKEDVKNEDSSKDSTSAAAKGWDWEEELE